MATKVISLLEADNASSNLINIIDDDATIDALWTTASTLVNGYMDFTSVLPGVYARYAQGYDNPVLTDAGTFTGKGDPDLGEAFSTDDAPPGFGGTEFYLPAAWIIRSDTTAHCADDTMAALAEIANVVNNLVRASANVSVIRPSDNA